MKETTKAKRRETRIREYKLRRLIHEAGGYTELEYDRQKQSYRAFKTDCELMKLENNRLKKEAQDVKAQLLKFKNSQLPPYKALLQLSPYQAQYMPEEVIHEELAKTMVKGLKKYIIYEKSEAEGVVSWTATLHIRSDDT